MKTKLHLILFGIFISLTSYSQTSLSTGDIAFLGMNLDGVDDYAFILLKDIDASTTISFTDQGWNDATGFNTGNTGEGMWTWSAGGARNCGTVVTITVNAPGFSASIGSVSGAVPVLSGIGDQIFAYQGNAASPTLISGIHSNVNGTNDANWDGASTSNSTSALPDVLTNGVNAIRLHNGGSEVDNWRYNCAVVNGTVATVRAAINNIANWTNDNGTPYSPVEPPCGWSITCVAPCTDPTIPTVTYAPATVCNGNNATLSISGTLNDATAWHVYTSACGGTAVGSTAGSTLVVTPPSGTTTYFVRGEGGCVTPGSCGTVAITTTALDDASFNYAASAYCADDTDPTPTITGLGGGGFTSVPAGLSINAGTGAVDVSTSTPNTYTVTYTTAGSCPNSSGVSVTVNALDDASFSYAASTYCVDATDPTPTITGLGGGSFSSTAGLSLNAGTGQIDVSASTPGTYTVTYTTSGTCPNSSGVSVTVNALDNASFNYSAAAYCSSDSDPTPTITGLGGGTFSSTAGLSINTSTGAIDVSASTPNTYTVTYTTAGSCPNSSGVSVTIDAIANQTVIPATATICSGSGTTIDLGSSEIGVSYTLRDDADDSIIAGPIAGTGGPISFNTGNITNTTTYNVYAGAPVSSTTLDFGGNGSGDFIDMGTGINSVFTGTNKITVEAWVKRSSTGSLQTIASNYATNMQFLLRVDNDRIVFWVSNGGFANANGGTILPVDTWMHVSGTWDGATIKVYYNGVLDGSTAYAGNMPTVSNTFRIGGGFGSEYFPGSIADVSIWNIAKTQSEIAADQTACITGVETGIVALYKMGDGTGSSSLTDLTGNGYDGTLNAMDVNTVWNSSFTPSCTTCSLEMTQTATVTVTPLDDAAYTYGSNMYAVDDTDPSAIITGLPGGTFSATPAGLSINAGTSAIDVSASAINTYTVTYTTTGPCPNSSDFSVQITAPLGVGENLLGTETSLYPNPNKGSFTLKYSGNEQLKELQVIDMLGKRVEVISLEYFANSQQINLSNLSKGMYFITIQSESAKVTKRMIIE